MSLSSVCYTSSSSPVPFIEDLRDSSLNIYEYSPSTPISAADEADGREVFQEGTWLPPSRSKRGSRDVPELEGGNMSRSNSRSSSYSLTPCRVSLMPKNENRGIAAAYLPFAKVPLAKRKEFTTPRKSLFETPAVKHCIFCDRSDRR